MMRPVDVLRPDDQQSGGFRPLAAFLTQPVIHRDLCLWFTFLAALDVLFTAVALFMGGSELNTLAHWIIERWDLVGMVAFKFVIVMLILCMVHVIDRLDGRAARRLAEWAVALTCIPVTLAVVQLVIAARVLSAVI